MHGAFDADPLSVSYMCACLKAANAQCQITRHNSTARFANPLLEEKGVVKNERTLTHETLL